MHEVKVGIVWMIPAPLHETFLLRTLINDLPGIFLDKVPDLDPVGGHETPSLSMLLHRFARCKLSFGHDAIAAVWPIFAVVSVALHVANAI